MRRRRLRPGGGRTRATACWTVALTLATAACGRQAPPDPAATFAAALGCYDVTLGPWTEMALDHEAIPSDPPPADDSLFYVIPPRVQLSNQPAFEGGSVGPSVPLPTDEPTAWSAAAPPGALPVGRPYQAWSVADGGEISLMYGDGMTGLAGELAPDGDNWRGPMEAFTDVGGITRWQRDVALLRVDCASPPPITDESVWLLPRSVELEGGLTLTLAERPSTDLPTYDRPGHAPGVAGLTSGLFAGADSVVMVLHRDRVAMIQMDFLPPATPDDLVTRITAAYGEPHVMYPPRRPGDRDTLPADPPAVWAYAWDGRITHLSVSPRSAGGFRAQLSDPRLY